MRQHRVHHPVDQRTRVPPVAGLAIQAYDVQQPQPGLLGVRAARRVPVVREARRVQRERGHPQRPLDAQPSRRPGRVRRPVQHPPQQVAGPVPGQLLGRARPQQQQRRRRRPLYECLGRVRREGAAVHDPHRAQRLPAGPDGHREAGQGALPERGQPYRGVGREQRPVLLGVARAGRYLEAQDALAAVLVDRLPGHRGVGEDPPHGGPRPRWPRRSPPRWRRPARTGHPGRPPTTPDGRRPPRRAAGAPGARRCPRGRTAVPPRTPPPRPPGRPARAPPDRSSRPPRRPAPTARSPPPASRPPAAARPASGGAGPGRRTGRPR